MSEADGFPKIESRFVLAPLAGVNDPAFRLLCRRNGASMVWSEMINSEALCNGSESTKFLLEHSEDERPLAFQLFGTKPESMARAARMIEPIADVIDINMACPANKVTRIGAGCALLDNLELAEKIMQSIVRSVKKPVSLKMRLGMSRKSINCVKLAKLAERSGIKAIALHARTAEQGYSGKPALDFIRQVKLSVSIPVFGNGNVIDGSSAKKMFDRTGCDYIMVGRGALGNPSIFSELHEYMETGKHIRATPETRLNMFMNYLEYSRNFKNIHLQYVKQHAAYFTKRIHDGKKARVRILKAKTLEEIIGIMQKLSD